MKINTQNCIDEIKRKYSDKISGKWKRNKKFSAYFNRDICTIRIFTNTNYPKFIVYSVETEDNNLITVLLEEVDFNNQEMFNNLDKDEMKVNYIEIDELKQMSPSEMIEDIIQNCLIDIVSIPKYKYEGDVESLDFENFNVDSVKGNRVKASQGGDWQSGMDVVYGLYKNIDNNKLEIYLLEFLLFDNDAE